MLMGCWDSEFGGPGPGLEGSNVQDQTPSNSQGAEAPSNSQGAEAPLFVT